MWGEDRENCDKKNATGIKVHKKAGEIHKNEFEKISVSIAQSRGEGSQRGGVAGREPDAGMWGFLN